MNIKALIAAALLVGSTSAALAAPQSYAAEVRDHRAATTVAFNEPVVRDHRSPERPTYSFESRHQRPVTELPPSPSTNGFATIGTFNAFDGTRTIDLGCGRFVNTLRIFSADGNNEVYNVVVHYADGQSATFSWNHIFATASDGQAGPYLQMGIGGRMVTSIQVSARNNLPRAMSVQIA